MALAHRVAEQSAGVQVDHGDQIMVDALERAAGTDERLFVPRVEATFEVHSPITRALSSGTFDVLLTAAPRPDSSMAGRFAHVLPPEHQDALAATYHGAPDCLTAQLVFPPRRHRNVVL